MKTFISGPMAGNRAAFDAEAARLRALNSALNAHIERATRLKFALTSMERSRIEREQSAAQEGADCMLVIALAIGQCDWWMKRLGVGRVSA